MAKNHKNSNKDPILIGLIGYGYWGQNLLRNFIETDGCIVKMCADTNAQAVNLVVRRYPAVGTTQDYHTVIKDPAIDAVVIATPVATHFPIAKEALESGKDVWIEKPMTASYQEAVKLTDLARRKKRLIMVDHTFIYTPAVRKIKELIDKGQLGNVFYTDSVRIALGLFYQDINCIYDLACHDFSIIHYLFNKTPTQVSASGIAHFDNAQENLAYVLARYDDRFIAHVHVSWLSPVKVRSMTISGSKTMIMYNDLEPSDKIRIYDKGVVVDKDPSLVYQTRYGYRSGDMLVPHLEIKEALSAAASHFIDCIQHRTKPDSDGNTGAHVVQILEAATKSLRGGGKVVGL